MSKAIIVDLDGTLIKNPCWHDDMDTFYKNIMKGEPVEWCVSLIKGMSAIGVTIIFVTARSECCEKETRMQLDSIGVPYKLYMRKSNDLRFDHRMKEAYLLEIMEKYDVLFCIDDNTENCRMFREHVPTLLVV